MLQPFNFQQSAPDIATKSSVFMSETGVSSFKSSDIMTMFDDVAMKTPDITAMTDVFMTDTEETETKSDDNTKIPSNITVVAGHRPELYKAIYAALVSGYYIIHYFITTINWKHSWQTQK
ncbi:MAG: hypothetical protein HYZ34_10785 [Ignavibacteriae bacterium]|nr:hypothetical protein [Ignavibacteriota bacterium]